MELAIIKASSGVSEVEAERLYQLQDKIILNDRVQDARNEASFYKEQTALKDDEISKLTSTLQDLQAKQTARGLEFTMNDFLFDFNKSTLKSGGERKLSPIAEFLTRHQDQHVKIEGHTDNVGSEQYNINLSEARSEAVKNALVNMGVSSARIVTKGLGEEYPVSSNDTEAGRLENRRVEIVITKSNDMTQLISR
jgi:OOP family OmpA-OmpF porin